MSNLSHLLFIGQKVRCNLDGTMYEGIVKETYEDHVIVDIPEVSDHCWFENGFNMDCVQPVYDWANNRTF